jgi:hypothetical protein
MSKILVDIYFLCDATGSMSTAINDVKTDMKAAYEGLCADMGNVWDIGTGLAWYRDTSDGDRDIFDNVLGITTDSNEISSAVKELKAEGGGDLPEAQMYALYQLARMENISQWRDGSYRYIGWFGDAYGHNPLVYRGTSYSEDMAINELNSKNIMVMSFNVASGNNGINKYEQASNISNQTKGEYYESVNQKNICREMYNVIQKNLKNTLKSVSAAL